MATPHETIEEYEQSVQDKIENNPEAIIVNCDNETEYSNFEECFPCDEYFNVQDQRCDTCDGELDPVKLTCK